MSRETPLQTVKRLHGDKAKLIEAVVKALEGVDSAEEDLDERLAGAANSKLLRLLDVANQVKDKYGKKDKLVDAVATAQGKAKDEDYREKLAELPLPKLLDLAIAAERRARRASA